MRSLLPINRKGNNLGRVLSLQIEVRNQLKEWVWENITLELHGIKHFVFKEGKSSNQILNHVYFQELNGLFLIDFAGFESKEHTLESIQKSPFYCVCEALKVKKI